MRCDASNTTQRECDGSKHTSTQSHTDEAYAHATTCKYALAMHLIPCSIITDVSATGHSRARSNRSYHLQHYEHLPVRLQVLSVARTPHTYNFVERFVIGHQHKSIYMRGDAFPCKVANQAIGAQDLNCLSRLGRAATLLRVLPTCLTNCAILETGLIPVRVL